MRRGAAVVSILAVLLLAGWAAARPTTAPKLGTWGHGSWSWFGDPRAVSIPGPGAEVVVGWIDWAGRVTVGSYQVATGRMRTHVVAAMFPDDHSAPSILVDPNHHLTVFFSGHNGAEMDYRTTTRPYDVTSWGPVHHVSQEIDGTLGFTYPNPVILPAEHDKLYLFWRGADWSADYATRTADGRWSQSHELISVPEQRPYVKVDGNGRNEIALAFTDGHPRNVLTSIYYATYRAGSLWTAGGRRIARIGSTPISPDQADVVYDAQATGIPSWVWDVSFDSRARPAIVYATFPPGGAQLYWYARFNGTRWVTHFLGNGGGTISPMTIEYEYSGGITLDHSDPSIVYLSKQVRDGWEIERWVTADGGAKWTHQVVVPAGGTMNVRPVVPRGWDGGPMGLLWLRGHYGSYTSYRTWIDFLPIAPPTASPPAPR
jgi:hypothetical protein